MVQQKLNLNIFLLAALLFQYCLFGKSVLWRHFFKILPGDDFQEEKYFFSCCLILYTLSLSVVIGGISFSFGWWDFYIILCLPVLSVTLFHIAFLAS